MAMTDTRDKAIVHAVVEGRMVRKRRETRARLLRSAHDVMSADGIDAAKIKDITDAANVGFGTFYNYFESKDALAAGVLDCLIHDLGERNVLATKDLGRLDPSLVMPISIRLIMRAVVTDPVWQWWAHRPDLLYDRMRRGFGPFGRRDMRDGVRQGAFLIGEPDIEALWRQSIWLMVGGIHDAVIGTGVRDSDTLVGESVMRMMGMPPALARKAAYSDLPAYPRGDVDWTFMLDNDEQDDCKSITIAA